MHVEMMKATNQRQRRKVVNLYFNNIIVCKDFDPIFEVYYYYLVASSCTRTVVDPSCVVARG